MTWIVKRSFHVRINCFCNRRTEAWSRFQSPCIGRDFRNGRIFEIKFLFKSAQSRSRIQSFRCEFEWTQNGAPNRYTGGVEADCSIGLWHGPPSSPCARNARRTGGRDGMIRGDVWWVFLVFLCDPIRGRDCRSTVEIRRRRRRRGRTTSGATPASRSTRERGRAPPAAPGRPVSLLERWTVPSSFVSV